MKVPPKRKGNSYTKRWKPVFAALNESPSEKEGKFHSLNDRRCRNHALNESPSEKEGKSQTVVVRHVVSQAPQ